MLIYTIIDGHCDTVSKLLEENKNLYDNDLSVSYKKMKENKAYIQFFASFIEKEYKNPLSRATALINRLYTELNTNPQIAQIKNYKDVLFVIENQKCGALFTIEDARALCGEIHNVDILYKLGIRAMTLAWNDNNEVTDGILSKEGKGLTEFGFEVVKRMNEINMIVDVSHITIKGFWDVLEASTKPVMASHSNAYSVCPHVRNLNDEQIKALIKSESMIGINLYPLFLNSEKVANAEDIIRHIDYILSLGGEDVLGLGSDFDGIDYTCSDVDGADKFYILFNEMLKRGYSEAIIEKISHKNFILFLKKTL